MNVIQCLSANLHESQELSSLDLSTGRDKVLDILFEQDVRDVDREIEARVLDVDTHAVGRHADQLPRDRCEDRGYRPEHPGHFR